MYKDINRIEKFNIKQGNFKSIFNIKERLAILKQYPRIGKTLLLNKDLKGEYRRLIIENYIIIYKIENRNIKVLRIYNTKENYLNNNMFMVKENITRYRCVS